MEELIERMEALLDDAPSPSCMNGLRDLLLAMEERIATIRREIYWPYVEDGARDKILKLLEKA